MGEKSSAAAGTVLVWGFVCIASFALAASSRNVVVSIPSRVEVEGDSMVLADIARISPPVADLARVPLGYTPYAGHYRYLQRSEIENSLRRWGVEVERITLEMEERVLVTRQSQVVGREEIQAAVEAYLAESRPDLEFSIRGLEIPADVVLPEGQVEVQVAEAGRLSRLEGASLKVDFLVNGRLEKSQWVRLSASARQPVLVLLRDIPFGEPVSRTDVRVEERDLERLEDYLTSPQELAGGVAKRPLRSGELVRSRDLRPATPVRRGEIVTLVARGKSFLVKTLGRARISGAQGDLIPVENLDSKQVVHATVVGEKTVEIHLDEGMQ